MPDNETNEYQHHTFEQEPPTGQSDSSSPSVEPAAPSSEATSPTPMYPQPVRTPASTARQHLAPVQTNPAPVRPDILQAPKSSPGMLVLQWLVYAFWGWTVLALGWLTSLVTNHYFKVDGWSDFFEGMVSYALASVIVLFIISIICDIFYARLEHSPKTGASMIIMIIHAVIFSIFGIGSLIIAVFGAVQLMIGDTNETNGPLAVIAYASIICVVYGATLLRTLKPRRFKAIAKLYWAFMALVVIAVVALAGVGPAAQVRLSKEDVALENGLQSVSQAITQHVSVYNELPTSLKGISSSLSGDALKIVNNNRVQYTAKERLSSSPASGTSQETSVYHYSLCVEYKSDKSDGYGASDLPRLSGTQKYEASPRTYQHDAGNVCYELQTDYTY